MAATSGPRQAQAPVLAFVNGDAVVRPEALRALADALDDDAVGLASGSLRLYDQPEVMNSAGNPLHFSGLSWAGGLGEPASAHAHPPGRRVGDGGGDSCPRPTVSPRWAASASRCSPTARTPSCRSARWQRGWRVRYVPGAVVLHRYEFSRNPLKSYLLERNRLFLVATLYERRTLAVLLPVLLALEVAVAAVSLKQGWFREKARGWWWLWRHRVRGRGAAARGAGGPTGPRP